MAHEAKHKHLEFIQGIIDRLGNNSFQIKNWVIALVTAILALAASKEGEGRIELFVVALLPVLTFWILDGYFLWQERLFRELYKKIAIIENEKQIDYQMEVKQFNKGINTWRKSMFSITLKMFYIPLLFVMALVAFGIQCF